MDANYNYTTTSSGGSALFSGVWLIFWLVVGLLDVIGLWKIFEKAGQAGWKALIPIYNIYVLLELVGRPAWWLVLFLIPFVNIVIALVLALDVAKAFGKSQLFGVVALWLFQFVGILMLGFGPDKYLGKVVTQPAPSQPTPPQAPPVG